MFTFRSDESAAVSNGSDGNVTPRWIRSGFFPFVASKQQVNSPVGALDRGTSSDVGARALCNGDDSGSALCYQISMTFSKLGLAFLHFPSI